MKIPVVDALQYNNWSEDIFRQMIDGGVAAVHVTISYHEDFRETIQNIRDWNRRFQMYSDLIIPGRIGSDAMQAYQNGQTAIYFGLQNCSPIEDDIGLIEVCYQLGVRFMQLSYNNQSLLATGCYEKEDSGITRMGHQVISEMNRLGLVIDMSHSAELSTLQAIEISNRPIAITHANPLFWHTAIRNKSNAVLKALSETGGMLGVSFYSHHLKNGSNCKMEEFCIMVAKTAEMIGVKNIGFGSDLCQSQNDDVVRWMRNGTWTFNEDYGEGSAASPGFPEQPKWFQDNRDFPQLLRGLFKVGFSEEEVKLIAAENWINFFETSFSPGKN